MLGNVIKIYIIEITQNSIPGNDFDTNLVWRQVFSYRFRI